MTFMEILKIAVQIIVIILLTLMSLVLHRIGTIRKWEIEEERKRRKDHGL